MKKIEIHLPTLVAATEAKISALKSQLTPGQLEMYDSIVALKKCQFLEQNPQLLASHSELIDLLFQ